MQLLAVYDKQTGAIGFTVAPAGELALKENEATLPCEPMHQSGYKVNLQTLEFEALPPVEEETVEELQAQIDALEAKKAAKAAADQLEP